MRKNKRILSYYFGFVLLGIVLLIWSCKNDTSSTKNTSIPVSEEAATNNFKIIAYYPGSTGKIDAETVSQLDQIIYSFLHLNGNKLDMSKKKDSLAISYLTSLKKKNPELKILLSLGGWGGCETCSEVFSTQEGREEFAESVKVALDKYNADGIDLDWEFPVVPGYPGHPYKPADRQNFTSLVKELRETLGEDFEISFAAAARENFMEKSIEWKKVMPIVDRVNIMSYDLVGSALTGHHTPLYSTPNQLHSADYAIQYLDSLGIPSEKIIIGAAFYARVFEGVEDISNGLYQSGKFKRAVDYNKLDDFIENNPGFQKFWDSIAQAPYSFNSEKGLFITYDDSLSIAKKTKYVIENDLGGIMFWELGGDRAENGLVDVIDRVKKNY
ncbi:MAG TPA: glycoside hydrolase family 18 protein [Salinimicrobium sp.]|nr:glycoside hydrolase family 18 protein [Salinimicrobium sp.]